MYVRSIDRHILTYKCDCMPVYSHVEYMYKYTIIHKYTHIKLSRLDHQQNTTPGWAVLGCQGPDLLPGALTQAVPLSSFTDRNVLSKQEQFHLALRQSSLTARPASAAAMSSSFTRKNTRHQAPLPRPRTHFRVRT